MTDEIAISHLQRRKIEGRVLIPFIEACREKFGEGPTHELVIAAIRAHAATDGARWADMFGADIEGLRRVAEELWAGGGGMELEVVGQTADRLDFNVTRCRYAEFYQELGLADLGSLIHCSRDHAMVEGFNDGLELTRSQTIMAGGSCCDFRFRRKA
ncbi:L-2-amino-thiazoline-4-carboxylic acid hydrolase [Reyranella soli]|uniref:2-amino-thiazoline-4-carboxylic acid hydrolase n=1 Tax=Reyranella soli TaxID=1230389 RepID=A0A512NAJ6_9HYPH|nr:L-2-amino-thiazoline-4-carboxylic acid hydrolase [Reyranella soli]GEP55978.1 2-amino-thiazoline-4-carboxylic acid hydrolase [Reyranella soli]